VELVRSIRLTHRSRANPRLKIHPFQNVSDGFITISNFHLFCLSTGNNDFKSPLFTPLADRVGPCSSITPSSSTLLPNHFFETSKKPQDALSSPARSVQSQHVQKLLVRPNIVGSETAPTSLHRKHELWKQDAAVTRKFHVASMKHQKQLATESDQNGRTGIDLSAAPKNDIGCCTTLECSDEMVISIQNKIKQPHFYLGSRCDRTTLSRLLWPPLI